MTVDPRCRLDKGLGRSNGCPLDRQENCELCVVDYVPSPAKIAALKTHYETLEGMAKDARKKYHEALLAAGDFKLGDVVWSDGKTWKIVAVNVGWKRLSYKAVQLLKSGEWSAHSRMLHYTMTKIEHPDSNSTTVSPS